MARTLRFRKNGKRIYEIRFSRGRDPLSGKQLTPYSMTWEVPENYSNKKADKEASQIEAGFITKCKNGEILTREEQREIAQIEAKKNELAKLQYNKIPTINEYIEIYLKEKAIGVSIGTIVNNRIMLRRFSKTYGNFKITEITKQMIREYRNEVFVESGLKWKTADNYYSILIAMFNKAVEDDVIENSPMLGVKRPRKNKDDDDIKKEKAYSEVELINILNLMKKEPLKWRTLILTMADTGARSGEICGLKWNHINLETGECVICNNVQYQPYHGTYEKNLKSGNSRTIIINDYVLSVLKQWKNVQKLFNIYDGSKIIEPVYVFENDETGNPMTPGAVYKHLHRLGKKYNIPDFHPHKLRHTMATIMIANNADIVSVSKKLGHSKPSITLNIYSHANKEAQQRANERFVNAVYQNME